MVLGTNRAAQIHAEAAQEGCFTGHYGMDGTSTGMRYALAGGQQVNAENATGLNHCIQVHENLSLMRSLEDFLRTAMNGLLASPGHFRTIVDENYRKVNIGLAWDRYVIWIVQQFEGDYVRYQQTPQLQGNSLVFEGQTVNGARAEGGPTKFSVDIYYHFLVPATRGQVTHTYCVDVGLQVASLIAPPRPGYFYGALEDAIKFYSRCPTPPDFPETVVAPQSYFAAQALYARVSSTPLRLGVASVQWVIADEWDVGETSFRVSADIGDVLAEHGPGVYQVIVWGNVNGSAAVVADFPVFYQVEPPTAYK